MIPNNRSLSPVLACFVSQTQDVLFGERLFVLKYPSRKSFVFIRAVQVKLVENSQATGGLVSACSTRNNQRKRGPGGRHGHSRVGEKQKLQVKVKRDT